MNFGMLRTCAFILAISFWTSLAEAAYQKYNQTSPANCRCLPGDACWPTIGQWNSLNNSVNGRLIVPRPSAYPCYGGAGFDAEQCQAVLLKYGEPHFLYNNSGSMWNFNWEDFGDQRCSLEGSYEYDTVCHEGSVPAYAVDIHTVQDIQAALSFANQNNLRIVVKSTGHDYLGRSTAPGALMIWMHNFQGSLQTKTSFTPSGCDSSQQFNSPVITVTGGKTWDEVLAQVHNELDGKYTVATGLCYDIAAAGGFTLGGGHGLLAPSFGLAVDHVLEMNVVTVDGKLITVNACENKDLFWALRGGGGGTFGIVTSITYKLHSVPSGFTAYSFIITDQNKTGNLSPAQVEDILEVLLRRLPELYDSKWGAYYVFSPASGYAVFMLVPADRADVLLPAEAFRKELFSMQAKSQFLVMPFANQAGQFVRHYDTFAAWRTWTDTTGIFDGFAPGFRITMATRLIPFAALSDSRGTAKTLVAGAERNGFPAGLPCIGVVGNGVMDKDPNQTETSITPAWRKAALLCYLFNVWGPTASNADIAATKSAVNAGVQVWRDAFPDSGSYFNEAFDEEPNWQQAFWGSNYARLLRIKKEVDPNGLFTCVQCVGSEAWDREGNCRV